MMTLASALKLGTIGLDIFLNEFAESVQKLEPSSFVVALQMQCFSKTVFGRVEM